MNRDAFTAKMEHFLSRFQSANAEETAEWLRLLWGAVGPWDGDLEASFKEAVDWFVASHRGGRPTVRQIVELSTRYAMERREAGKKEAPPPATLPLTVGLMKRQFISRALDKVRREKRLEGRGPEWAKSFTARALDLLGVTPSATEQMFHREAAQFAWRTWPDQVTDGEWETIGPKLLEAWRKKCTEIGLSPDEANETIIG